MRRGSSILLVLFFTILSSAQAQKKRVAVMNFDYSTVSSYVSQIFGSNQDIGKGIADILVDRLVTDGTYRVIERKELDKIIAEQNFSNSDRADASTAAKIARILGVDAIVIGSITQFGNDNSTTKCRRRSVGRRHRPVRHRRRLEVEIHGGGADHRSHGGYQHRRNPGERPRQGRVLARRSGASGLRRERVRAFGRRRHRHEVQRLSEHHSGRGHQQGGHRGGPAVGYQSRRSLPTVDVEIDGLVADAAPDGTLVLNVGSRSGLKVGDTLNVKRKVREVRDPDSGKVLRVIEDAVGTVTITEVEASSAVGKFSGPGNPKVKDTVSNK